MGLEFAHIEGLVFAHQLRKALRRPDCQHCARACAATYHLWRAHTSRLLPVRSNVVVRAARSASLVSASTVAARSTLSQWVRRSGLRASISSDALLLTHSFRFRLSRLIVSVLLFVASSTRAV